MMLRPKTFTAALWVVLGLAISLAPAARAQAPQYVVTDLGTLGGSVSQAFGVNNSGEVTGSSYTPADQYVHAFRFSNGVMLDLGTLGGNNSTGFAINASGQVAGGAQTLGSFRAFRYSGGTMTNLGTMGGGSNSSAFGINASGQVAGYSDTSGSTPLAFRYSGGTMTSLGTLGGSSSQGVGINDAGYVVGWADPVSNNRRAFLYNGTSMSDLGTLGGASSQAFGINNTGQVVGDANLTGNAVSHAVLYSGGNRIDLGTLGGTGSVAWSINAGGQVVGSSLVDFSTQHAFLYSGGTMYDLNNLVPVGQDAFNIVMEDVGNHINDRGQIVAQAHNGSQPHAVLMTPRGMGTQFSGGIGDLAGGSIMSIGMAMSADGAVGTGTASSATGTRAYRWTLTGGLVEITTGSGNAISADGSAIAGSLSNNNAFRWTQGGGTQILSMPGGVTSSSATGLSADGSVVAGGMQSGANLRAFRWTQADGAVDLGLLSGGTQSYARGISSDGTTVVGESDNALSALRAIRWQGGVLLDLGTLPGADFSRAWAASANGSVVVGESEVAAVDGGGVMAFRWTSGGGMVGLGYFAGGTYSQAKAVSGDGAIVSGFAFDGIGQKAFVWDEAGSLRNLQAVLASEYGVTFANWTLRDAKVAQDGRSVTGEAQDPLGNLQAFNAQINSRTYRFVSGETYAGFHTSRLGGFGTEVDLIGGTAGGVHGTFRTVTVDLLAMPSVQFPLGFASDVVDVTGTGADTFVLRLGYDEAVANAFYGSEVLARLGWFDTSSGTWKNAVDGNTGGTPLFVGPRAYNATLDAPLGTPLLGVYGVDTVNNQVWAVINHNSDFAAVPEPGSAALLALGIGLAGLGRRRIYRE